MKAAIKKHYIFICLNIASILLLNIWLFRNCTKLDTSITAIIMDFSAMITCVYCLIRVVQSLNGDFKIIDMVTIYYASLFFLLSWIMKMLYLVWDHFWVYDHDDLSLIISIVVVCTLASNFYTVEKVNLNNLEKIESDL